MAPSAKLLPLLALACLGPLPLGAADHPMPLWAYGVTTPPQAGDKAIPQALPSRALRPGEDPTEQTRLRRVEGSDARSIGTVSRASEARSTARGSPRPPPGRARTRSDRPRNTP